MSWTRIHDANGAFRGLFISHRAQFVAFDLGELRPNAFPMLDPNARVSSPESDCANFHSIL